MTENYAARLLHDAARRWPEREALVRGEQRWSYTELVETTTRFAGVLGPLVQPGEDVAVLSGNRPELVAVQLAAHLLGCRYVAASTAVPRTAVERLLRGLAPAVLVFDAPASTGHAAELAATVRPRHTFSLGPAPLGRNLLGAPAAGAVPDAAPGESVKTVFLTGGTTGVPQAVQHGAGQYRCLRSLIGSRGVVEPGERRLVCAPLTYISSHFALPALMSGGTLVLNEGFEPATVLATLVAERINAVLLSTALLDVLLDHPGLADVPLPSLRRIQYGASRYDVRRLRLALDRFGPVLQQVYGLTEAGVVSLLHPGEHDVDRPDLLASAGRPVPGVELQIRDEHGEPTPVGRVGEVWVHGPGVMEGYLLVEPDAQPLDGGWLRTGDAGRLDDDGRLFVVDRLKDLLLVARTGLRVWAGEVERALRGHRAVHDAAVIGVPDTPHGERVHAVVTLTAEADEDELRAHVLAELGHEPSVPERVHVVDALPLTAVGKVDKKALRLTFADARERP